MSRSLRSLSLFALAVATACAGENPTGPESTASLLANNAAAPVITRVAGGTCNTTITVVAPFPDFTPGAFQPILNLDILGVCNLRHLGLTTGVTTQTVNLLTGQFDNFTTYTAANGDVVVGVVDGHTVFNNGVDVIFEGVETYVSGTGRFAGVSGSSDVKGTAHLTGLTGVGEFTTEGSITF
jgi:hypothetical protein